jgi:hypothetical protein
MDEGSSEVESLARFLKEQHPRDVLIPLHPKKKQPLYPHKGGTWSWAEFDAFFASAAASDGDEQKEETYGILLREICAIDFDDDALAEAFEAEFPCMAEAPMETTRKGRHYLFLRPPWADAVGYFDGARQIPGLDVDFKSVCSTGTSGVLSVAPSPGKTWVRAPWLHRLFEIPAPLLVRVARPRLKGQNQQQHQQHQQKSAGRPRQEVDRESQIEFVQEDSKENREFVRTVVLECLDASHARNYSDWRDVGFALKLMDPRYLDIFKEFSMRSPVHGSADDLRACEELWESAKGPEQAGQDQVVTFNTIAAWARADNPARYSDAVQQKKNAKVSVVGQGQQREQGPVHQDQGQGQQRQDLQVMQTAIKLHEILQLPSEVASVVEGDISPKDKVLELTMNLQDGSRAVVKLNCETLLATAEVHVGGRLDSRCEKYLNDSQATALRITGVDISCVHKDLRPGMEWRVARPCETRAVFAAHGDHAQNATIELLNVNDPSMMSARLEFRDNRKTFAVRRGDVNLLHSAYAGAMQNALKGELGMGWVLNAIENHGIINSGNGTINIFAQAPAHAPHGMHTTDGTFADMIVNALGTEALGIVALNYSEFYVWKDANCMWEVDEHKGAADTLRTAVKRRVDFWESLSVADQRYIDSQRGCQTLLDAVIGHVRDRDFKEKLDKPPPGSIPFENGMFEIETGVLRPFRRSDYISKTVGYAYDSRLSLVHAETIQRFYEQIFPVLEEREYFQQEIAAALFGAEPAKQILVLVDERDGANGKTTMMRAVEAVFGFLAANSERSFLYSSTLNNPNGHSANLLAFVNTRLAFFDEPEPNNRLDMRKLKDLSSGDARIRGRNFQDAKVVNEVWRSLIVIASNEANFPTMDVSDMPMIKRIKALKMRSLFLPPETLVDHDGEEFVFDLKEDGFKERINTLCRSAHFDLLVAAYGRRRASGKAPLPACVKEMVDKIIEHSDPRVLTALDFLDAAVDFTPARPEGKKGCTIYAYITEKDLRAAFWDWYESRASRDDRQAKWKGPLRHAMARFGRACRTLCPIADDGKQLSVMGYDRVAWRNSVGEKLVL